jgi:hypothetical protein
VNTPNPSTMIAGLLAAVSVATATGASDRRQPLEPSTIADWRAAGMDGTGCYWSGRRGGPVLVAAAGRTAVTRMAGHVVVLSPHPKAAEMFPFTYDAWTGPGLEIRIEDSGVVRAMGYETVTTDATMTVITDRIVTRLRGSMICGS